MTSEEAIDLLDNLNGMIEDSRNSDYDTAFKMAIKALEQEDCEDCISRESVLAIAGDSCLDLNSYEDTKEFCDEIKDLPPVTPQPKTDVLDKIIAEIENTEIKGYIRDVECYNAGINFALHIIAKYKSESEE